MLPPSEVPGIEAAAVLAAPAALDFGEATGERVGWNFYSNRGVPAGEFRLCFWAASP
jgi:hypothetical protein